MTKWADYLISAVWKDSNKVITHVYLHIDNGDSVGPGIKTSETDAIKLLKEDKTIYTITKSIDGKWNKGAEVIYLLSSNHKQYLKTEANARTSDNLDNLPVMN